MPALGLMLRAQLPLATLRRRPSGERSLLLVMFAVILLLSTALWPRASSADEVPSPPWLSLRSSPAGGGVWEIIGHVSDEDPATCTVTLSGAPLPNSVTLEVDANGDFFYYVSILGPGLVYGVAHDDDGLNSSTAGTFVGY